MIDTAFERLDALAWSIVLCGVALLAVSLRRRYFSPIADIPGPVLASFSTIWQIWHVVDGHTEKAYFEQHQKHGDFVRVSHKEVSCSHADSIAAILVPSIRKGDWYQAMAVPDKYHQTVMSEQDPQRHKERSSIIKGGYSLAYLLRSEPLIDECISQFKVRMGQLADTNKPVELDKWLNYLAFDIIGDLIYSRRFGFLDKGQDIGGSIKNTRFLMFYQSLMGYMYWLHPILLGSPLSGWLGLRPSRHIFDTVVSAVKARTMGYDSRPDMIELWTKNYGQYPQRMKEQELLASASMTTIAGSETMTGALETVFYFLLRNPGCLETLTKELEAADVKGMLSDVVKWDEAKELPYLQACIKESLRYFPAVAFGFPRIAPKEGVTIGDRYFPAGTVLSVNPYVIQRSTKFFGADANVFRPERWLEPGNQALDKYLILFGTGYNGCPGKQFAYAEMSKVVATTLKDFEFSFVDPKREWSFRTQFTVVQTGWPCWVRHKTSAMPKS